MRFARDGDAKRRAAVKAGRAWEEWMERRRQKHEQGLHDQNMKSDEEYHSVPPDEDSKNLFRTGGLFSVDGDTFLTLGTVLMVADAWRQAVSSSMTGAPDDDAFVDALSYWSSQEGGQSAETHRLLQSDAFRQKLREYMDQYRGVTHGNDPGIFAEGVIPRPDTDVGKVLREASTNFATNTKRTNEKLYKRVFEQYVGHKNVAQQVLPMALEMLTFMKQLVGSRGSGGGDAQGDGGTGIAEEEARQANERIEKINKATDPHAEGFDPAKAVKDDRRLGLAATFVEHKEHVPTSAAGPHGDVDYATAVIDGRERKLIVQPPTEEDMRVHTISRRVADGVAYGKDAETLIREFEYVKDKYPDAEEMSYSAYHALKAEHNAIHPEARDRLRDAEVARQKEEVVNLQKAADELHDRIAGNHGAGWDTLRGFLKTKGVQTMRVLSQMAAARSAGTDVKIGATLAAASYATEVVEFLGKPFFTASKNRVLDIVKEGTYWGSIAFTGLGVAKALYTGNVVTAALAAIGLVGAQVEGAYDRVVAGRNQVLETAGIGNTIPPPLTAYEAAILQSGKLFNGRWTTADLVLAMAGSAPAAFHEFSIHGGVGRAMWNIGRPLAIPMLGHLAYDPVDTFRSWSTAMYQVGMSQDGINAAAASAGFVLDGAVKIVLGGKKAASLMAAANPLAVGGAVVFGGIVGGAVYNRILSDMVDSSLTDQLKVLDERYDKGEGDMPRDEFLAAEQGILESFVMRMAGEEADQAVLDTQVALASKIRKMQLGLIAYDFQREDVKQAMEYFVARGTPMRKDDWEHLFALQVGHLSRAVDMESVQGQHTLERIARQYMSRLQMEIYPELSPYKRSTDEEKLRLLATVWTENLASVRPMLGNRDAFDMLIGVREASAVMPTLDSARSLHDLSAAYNALPNNDGEGRARILAQAKNNEVFQERVKKSIGLRREAERTPSFSDWFNMWGR